MRRSIRCVLVAAALCSFVVAAASPALAHEVRKVGTFQFTVGWGDEPAYTGLKNSVQLILKDRSGKPVTDLTDTLKVTVIFQGQTQSFPLEPTFDPDTRLGTPGDYRAWLIPTRPGNYTFLFTGSIHGQKIDESFTSSPTTFDPVKAPAEVEFPAKDPTNADLSTLVQQVNVRTAMAKDVADKGKSTAGTALILGVIGVVLGAGGLLVGVTARRRKAA
ncbi:MAG TPA: hypothetical protein VJ818_07560 [Actinomycetota bacterium]|nr:hypothetical protein [Actinomycetota bacterium]